MIRWFSSAGRHGIAHEVCGKVIVATKEAELPSLKALQQRGLENGLEVAWMSPQEVAKIEPHVRCLAGLRVPSTGIADYREVVAKYAALVEAGGGVIKKSAALLRFRNLSGSQVLETSLGEFESPFCDQLRWLVQRPHRALGRGRAQGAHHPFPGRVLRVGAGKAAPGKGAGLPGARSYLPFPWCSFHPSGRRLGARRGPTPSWHSAAKATGNRM